MANRLPSGLSAAPPDPVVPKLPPNYWRYQVQALILSLAMIGVLSMLLLWDTEPDLPPFNVGEAATSDVLSPARITYQSQIATEQAQDRAAGAVSDIYTQPNAEIVQQQLAYAQAIFEYMDAVRNDPYLTPSQRVAKIAEIPEFNVSTPVIRTALGFDESTWTRTISTTLRAVEAVMMEGVRENQLLQVRGRLSNVLSSDVLSAEQEKVVVGIGRALITPTSFYDQEKTAAARQKAREAVEPVERTLEKGQAIVRAGDIVTELDMEELRAVGLLHQRHGWQEILGTTLFAAVLVLLPMTFIQRLRVGFWAHWRRLLLIHITLALSVILAKFMIPNHVLLPYLFPMATISMLLTLLLEDPSLAIVVTISISLAVGFIANGSLEFVILSMTTGIVALLTILKRERLSAFIRAGLFVALAHAVISVGFRLYEQNYDLAALSQLTTAGLFNGMLSASVAFATFSWLGRLFGITTTLQLLELARPTQPLLKQLALKAPGTYHHTIIVANMAEQAAEAIGANGLLTRIGAYYHDIGKSVRPYFFIENASEEDNIHARLDPDSSAQIITSHVTDGLELAKKHKLPTQIGDIILQHHGTTRVGFFYQQALEQAEQEETVFEENFRYPGPKPQSKEAAIVMLADVEAAVRSQRPSTVEETEQLIRRFINKRLTEGQLDECALTLRDLEQIRTSFVSVLKGVFHPRIQYPPEEIQPPMQALPSSSPPLLELATAKLEATQYERKMMSQPNSNLYLNIQIAPDFERDVDQAALQKAVEVALDQDPPEASVEVSLVITDDETVRTLNRTYRDIDATTDVLAFSLGENEFALEDKPAYLGDVIISYPRSAQQAQEYGHTIQQEMNLLAIHGILHLLGYDHATDEERTKMWQLQKTALVQSGNESVTPLTDNR